MFRNAAQVVTTAVSLLVAPVAASAEPTSPACFAPAGLTRLDYPIARTATRLAARQALKIVALGSSSTFGIGATSPAQSYPSRLEAELRERFPDTDIVVLNRGVGGEDAREMLARMEKSVLAEKPDLVLWQVGTNAITGDESTTAEAALVRTGLMRLRAHGIDVILIDPQYVPKIIAKRRANAMVRVLHASAYQQNVAVFHRFAVMDYWRRAMQIPFRQFTTADDLHMNDWGYHCFGRLLAQSLADAINQSAPAATKPTVLTAAR
jgi:lysophospholipase L1-like esterase